MSERLEVRAELLKLARLLQSEPEDLGYLEGVGASDLRALREQVTERLFDAHDGTFRRLAAASKLLPPALIATIGERAFGPLLSARIAGSLDAPRAADAAARMSPGFLADVAVELDPRRASDVIGRIPPAQVASITRELMERQEYVTLGRFVGHIGIDALGAALGELSDRDLLQVAFVIEGDDSLNEVIGLLPADRLEGLIRTGADDDLWQEALELLSKLSPAAQRRFVDSVAGLPETERAELAGRAREANVLEHLGPLREALG